MLDEATLSVEVGEASSGEQYRGESLFSAPNQWIERRTVEVQGPGLDEVLIKVEWSYVSAGTEMNAVHGCRAGDSEFIKPRRMGYSLAGRVEAVGSNVQHVRCGDRVAAIGAGAFHGTWATVAKNLVCPLPENVDTKQASCCAMLCFALEGVRKAQLQFGENVVVLGGGLMGQIASRLCATAGANVRLIDANTRRLAFCDPRVTPLELNDETWTNLASQVMPYGLDVGFVCFGGDASAATRGLVSAMGRGPDDVAMGRVVFCGGAEVRLRMASPSGNVQFLSSAKAGPGYRDSAFEQGADYTMGYVKWTVKRNMEVLLAGMGRGLLDISALITHEFSFGEAESAYELLGQKNTEAMAVVLKYE